MYQNSLRGLPRQDPVSSFYAESYNQEISPSHSRKLGWESFDLNGSNINNEDAWYPTSPQNNQYSMMSLFDLNGSNINDRRNPSPALLQDHKYEHPRRSPFDLNGSNINNEDAWYHPTSIQNNQYSTMSLFENNPSAMNIYDNSMHLYNNSMNFHNYFQDSFNNIMSHSNNDYEYNSKIAQKNNNSASEGWKQKLTPFGYNSNLDKPSSVNNPHMMHNMMQQTSPQFMPNWSDKSYYNYSIKDMAPSLKDPSFIYSERDQKASNGFFHPINGVLMPFDTVSSPSLAGIIAKSGSKFDNNSQDFDIFHNALSVVGLMDDLDNLDKSFTVLGPNDAAFISLAKQLGSNARTEEEASDDIVDILTTLGNGDPVPVLRDILSYHIIPESKSHFSLTNGLRPKNTLLDGGNLSFYRSGLSY